MFIKCDNCGKVRRAFEFNEVGPEFLCPECYRKHCEKAYEEYRAGADRL